MISVRRARASDIPLLARLEREFDRDEHDIVLKTNPKLKPYLRVDSSPRFRSQRMRKWVASRNALVLVAEADSIPCGFSVAWIGTHPSIYRPKRYGFIGIMFVQGGYRGRRIGSLMMKDALGWFTKRKVKHVVLTVMTENTHARRIYEKWGFFDFVAVMWNEIHASSSGRGRRTRRVG
jgi:GNAT superfamily N-acetyltransferase